MFFILIHRLTWLCSLHRRKIRRPVVAATPGLIADASTEGSSWVALTNKVETRFKIVPQQVCRPIFPVPVLILEWCIHISAWTISSCNVEHSLALREPNLHLHSVPGFIIQNHVSMIRRSSLTLMLELIENLLSNEKVIFVSREPTYETCERRFG